MDQSPRVGQASNISRNKPSQISQINNDTLNKGGLSTIWLVIISIITGIFIGQLFFGYIIRGILIDKIFINNPEKYRIISLFLVTIFPFILCVLFILLVLLILRKINKKPLNSLSIIFLKFLPIAFIQYYLCSVIGWMSYCGIEGTCEYPHGLTSLLLAINLFIDLLIILFLSFKKSFSVVNKISIIVLVLLSTSLIYFGYKQMNKDDENIRQQKMASDKKSAEDHQKYEKDVVIPEQQKQAACKTEFQKQLNANNKGISSDRLSQQGEFKIYDYTLGISMASQYDKTNYSNYTKAKLFVPKEFTLFFEPPKDCPDTNYYLGFWDSIHNLYIQEESTGNYLIKNGNQGIALYDLIDKGMYPDILAKFSKKEINGKTIYYSKELKAPYYIIVSLPWNTKQNDWSRNKRFVYSIVDGSIDQNLVDKLIQSASNVSLE